MIQREKSIHMVHPIPKDIKEIFNTYPLVKIIWDSLTPLARNEWICWIVSAKKTETRNRRIKIMHGKLLAGSRRPCCWAGCIHR